MICVPRYSIMICDLLVFPDGVLSITSCGSPTHCSATYPRSSSLSRRCTQSSAPQVTFNFLKEKYKNTSVDVCCLLLEMKHFWQWQKCNWLLHSPPMLKIDILLDSGYTMPDRHVLYVIMLL